MVCLRDDFVIETKEKSEIVLLTDQVLNVVIKSRIKNGICLVYTKHTTSAIAINEADPSVRSDLLLAFKRLSPRLEQFQHLEGNSPAHVLASIVGPSETIPVKNGKLDLGTWQGIYFCEFDGPRKRDVCVQVLG